MIRIDDLGLFIRSAALGSFTAAALEADLLPGQVAAAIKRLERELDVRLFARTTRSLRLTAEGEQYLPTAHSVLETLQQGKENLRGENATLRGVLQVTAPSDLGRNILLPWLTQFRRQHPELTLRFFLSDQMANLFRDPVDVAIRYGPNEDANYVALPLAPWNQRVLVASPEYVQRCGSPQTPDDLSKHACSICKMAGSTTSGTWAGKPCRFRDRCSAMTPMSCGAGHWRVKVSPTNPGWMSVQMSPQSVCLCCCRIILAKRHR